MSEAAAILVAAGSGERLGADRPKAFVVLAGRPMLEWSLEALAAAAIADVVVAAPARTEADGSGGHQAVAWTPPAGVTVVEGGATRSASVRAALAAVPAGAQAIVVHDAARPLVTSDVFRRTLAALDGADAAIAAAPVPDTIKEAGPDGVVRRTLDRSRLWAVQTPQAFRASVLRRAVDVDDPTLARATDDAWLVERAGGRVVIVDAPPGNFKVTTPDDLRAAALLLASR